MGNLAKEADRKSQTSSYLRRRIITSTKSGSKVVASRKTTATQRTDKVSQKLVSATIDHKPAEDNPVETQLNTIENEEKAADLVNVADAYADTQPISGEGEPAPDVTIE